MRITENRIIAGVVCVVCALVSMVVIVGCKLNSRFSEVNDYFLEGEDERHNMEAYLDRSAEYAGDLAQEAKRYLVYDEEIDAVIELSEALASRNGPAAPRYENYSALSDAVEDLYTQLQIAGSYEETGVKIAYGDFKSAADMIKRDPYHERAKEYNELIDAFPAGMLAALWNAGPADTFGY